MKIESRDLSVDDLLTGSYFFIPRFQRPYSWEEENILDFWTDITENSEDNYFIGSMVVYHERQSTLGVVDGQQRLTTIMILLCCIRDAFLEIGEEDKSIGLHKFIEKPNRDNKNMFVLQTESSFPYLQEKILKQGEPQLRIDVGDEERTLEKAHKIFSSSIKKKLNLFDADNTISADNKLETKTDWLVQLRDAVLALNVILITLDKEDDAYLIFETLNTRGKDLALSDLVKNLFTRSLKPKGDIDHAKIIWGEVLETLSASDIDLSPDAFIVHSWSSRYEAVTQKKAFPKLRTAITNRTAKTHLDEFLKDAEQYRSIFEPSFKWKADEKKVAKSLSALQLFKVVQPTPGLLSLVRSYRDEKIKLGKLVKAVRAIEYFHFGFTAVTSSRSSGGISAMYSSFGRKLYEATDSNVAASEITSFVSKLRERRPSSSEFSAAFEQILYTNALSKQRLLIRYILLKIAAYSNSPHVGSEEDLTIEHLVPQSKIGNEWPASIVGQIGNLILVDEETNGLLSTKSFKDKKAILLDRNYNLPGLFLATDELTPELIIQNTNQLGLVAHENVWKF